MSDERRCLVAYGASSVAIATNELIVPENPRILDEWQVRHLWRCPKCDCCFKTVALNVCRLVEWHHSNGLHFAAASRRLRHFGGAARNHSPHVVTPRPFAGSFVFLRPQTADRVRHCGPP